VTRVLVFQTAWLGDVVLTTPLLAALAEQFGPVDVVTTPDAAPLLATHPGVAAVLPYDKRGRERGPFALARLAGRLRRRGYERAVLPQGSLRSALLARLAAIPHRITFAGTVAAPWCTERRPRVGRHEAERLRGLADGRGLARLTLGLTAEDRAAAREALERAGVQDPFVALAPGSARATKRWPHFGRLARDLGDGMAVVVGTPGDFPPDARGAAYDCTGLPLRASAALLARAAVAVTNDSLALHLAQAVGTTTVALFGPTHPDQGFGPRGARDRAVGLDLACRPCSTHGGRRCPLRHHRCLRDLAPDTVRAHVGRALAHMEAPCG
jgi:heptosyltransferase-2